MTSNLESELNSIAITYLDKKKQRELEVKTFLSQWKEVKAILKEVFDSAESLFKSHGIAVKAGVGPDSEEKILSVLEPDVGSNKHLRYRQDMVNRRIQIVKELSAGKKDPKDYDPKDLTRETIGAQVRDFLACALAVGCESSRE